jgi:hypothetical protein
MPYLPSSMLFSKTVSLEPVLDLLLHAVLLPEEGRDELDAEWEGRYKRSGESRGRLPLL